MPSPDDEKTLESPFADVPSIDALLAIAQRDDACWRIQGSSDWKQKPGRFTVWVELPESHFDEVYDTLNGATDLIQLHPEAKRES